MTVDGRRLAYEEVSPPDPEATVLLLCGIGAKRQGWYKQLPVLGRRFRTLALDYRDVGDSDAAGGPYTIAELADDVAGARAASSASSAPRSSASRWAASSRSSSRCGVRSWSTS